ncbi:DUF488 family protein, N3 subclade [Haladaptatus salinisoli]|uniref:DUF488 family protein, N3 subclade n=1 Tax=Haladaptatus salinisoli TaxID=2884876 RepID=UPI001D09F9C0
MTRREFRRVRRRPSNDLRVRNWFCRRAARRRPRPWRYPPKYDFFERTVDRNCPALAPPRKLLNQFKKVEKAAESDGIPDPARAAWASVSCWERYLGFLERPGPRQCIKGIRDRLDDGQDVWLVCLEKDDTFCHRRLLAARVRGSSPTHWSELHELPEQEFAKN